MQLSRYRTRRARLAGIALLIGVLVYLSRSHVDNAGSRDAASTRIPPVDSALERLQSTRNSAGSAKAFGDTSRQIDGEVRYDDGGPVSGALVHVKSLVSGQRPSVMADEQGRFLVRLSDREAYALCAAAPRSLVWGKCDVEAGDADCSVVISIDRAASLTVSVRSEDGRGLVAEVSLESPTSWDLGSPLEIRSWLKVPTGEDGFVRVDGIPVVNSGSPVISCGLVRTNLWIGATSPGYVWKTTRAEILQGENHVTITMTRAPAELKFSGVVVETDGTPAAGVSLEWWHFRGAHRKGCSEVVSGTPASGQFEFSVPPSLFRYSESGEIQGTGRIRAKSEDSAETFYDIEVLRCGMSLSDIRIVLDPGIQVECSVTDTDDRPIPFATVSFLRQEPGMQFNSGDDMETDDKGTLRARFPRNGRYLAIPSAKGFHELLDATAGGLVSERVFEMPIHELKLVLRKDPE